MKNTLLRILLLVKECDTIVLVDDVPELHLSPGAMVVGATNVPFALL